MHSTSHKAVQVLVFIFGLALIGAAVAQVFQVPQWQFWGSDNGLSGPSKGKKVQNFLLYGLAPLFAGLAIVVYVAHKCSKASKQGVTTKMADDTQDLLE